MKVLLQTVQKNSHKIIATFRLMTKKTFIKNHCGSDSFIDNFKSSDFVILDHCVLPRDTVIKKNLTRLSKSINKKGSDLLTDNFHCFSSNRHTKNTQKYTYMFEKVNLESIF